YEKRSSLRQVLVHVQKINHGRHQNYATPDAQKAHQHTNPKSQQENDECHGDRTGLRVSFRIFRLKPFYLPLSGPASNVPFCTHPILRNAPLFLFAPNLLYLTVFVTSALWPAGGSVAACIMASPKTRKP